MTYVDIDKMTSSQWLAYRDNLLDQYYADGNLLVASEDCKECDPDNEYVCFNCECMQIEKWRAYST